MWMISKTSTEVGIEQGSGSGAQRMDQMCRTWHTIRWAKLKNENQPSLSQLVRDVIMKYHRLGDLKPKEIHFSVSKAASLRSGCQHGQALVRAFFWVTDRQLLIVSSYGRE